MQVADVAEPPAGARRPWAPLALRRGVPLRRRLLYGLQSSLGATGIAEAYVRTRRPAGAMILMYHSVAAAEDAQWIDPQNHMPPEVFERHMRLLAERRRVIALDELVECVSRGVTPPAGTVVITFDDGYRDNLTVAAPILARYRLPATLFLATGYVSRRQSQWIDELYGIFRTRTRPSLALGGRAWRLDSGAAAWDAYQAVASELLIADYAARHALLEAVAGQLAPAGQPPRLTMDWDDVRAWMAVSPGLSVGLHTRDHVDLTARTDSDARAELAACMAECPLCPFPTVDFTADVTTAETAPLAVTFTRQVSYPADCGRTVSHWDFGDGSSSYSPNDVIKHVYQQEGVYSVELRVTNGAGPGIAFKQDYIILGEQPDDDTADDDAADDDDDDQADDDAADDDNDDQADDDQAAPGDDDDDDDSGGGCGG